MTAALLDHVPMHAAVTAQIARRPLPSEATVRCHVARVLLKLGVRDRVQAVVSAFRTGPVPARGNRSTSQGGRR